MAITRKKKVPVTQHTKNYSRICTLVQGGTSGVGLSQYYISWTEDFTYPVTNVTISNVGGPYAAKPTFSINDTRVTYTCTSPSNIEPITFTSTVTVAGGYEDVAITDIKATSEREINYVKTSSGKYLWSRPTSIDLQFPWNAFSSWSIVRLAGSKNPDAIQGLVWYNGNKTTSDTNTYSFSNIYYGDKLRLDYTAKPGAVIGQANKYEFTVDPTFSISNIRVDKSDLPDPTAELRSQWSFGEGDWSTVSSTSNRDEFILKVTKPASAQSLATKVYVWLNEAECFYRTFLNVITYINTSADVYFGSTKLSVSEKTLLGTIPAGTASQDFTLKVKCSGANYWWPKAARLGVSIEAASSDHYFTSDSRYTYVTGGTFETTGSSGGGGWGGGGGGGMGGTGYGSNWN